MYQSDEHPTQELPLVRPRGNRHWLVAGGALAAVAVLLLAFAVVGRDSGEPPRPAHAATAPTLSSTPTASATPTSDADAGEDSGSDGGGGEPVGGGESGGGPGGEQKPGGGDPPPATPDPVQVDVSVEVPPLKIGCTARGWIKLAGGEYPLDVTYQWFRMTKIGNHTAPLPFSEELTVSFTEPGMQGVETPPFPAADPQNPVQLRTTGPAVAATGFVNYPQCAD